MEHQLKVLFADDSTETIEFLRWRAKDEGWDATFVTTARGIIEAVNENCSDGKHCFDIIVADVNYFDDSDNHPRLTGITAAREIRKQYPNIPILFISAWITILVREEARKLDGQIMSKPFDWDDLVERIKYLVSWNRRVTASLYEGEERRINSLNHSSNSRRDTDSGPISVPKSLETMVHEIRAVKEAAKLNGN